MQKSSENPLINFKRVVEDLFAKEAKRLRDPTVLTNARDLFLSSMNALRQIGTDEHELGAKFIMNQLAAIRAEARYSRRSIRSQFAALLKGRVSRVFSTDHVHRDLLKTLEQLGDKSTTKATDTADHEYERSRAELDEMAAEIISGMLKLDESLHALQSNTDLELSLLSFDAKLHLSTYTRVFIYGITSFVFEHGFRVLVSVIVAGIGYSFLVGKAKSFLPEVLARNALWMFLLLLIAGIFKEYVLGKYIRRIRLAMEVRLLRPIALKVFGVSFIAMLHRVQRRPTNSKSQNATSGNGSNAG